MDIKSVKEWWRELCTVGRCTPDEAETLVHTVDDLIAEVERLTKENEAHKEFTVARVKVLAQKLDCSEGLPGDSTIYGCVGTILGMFRLRVEVLVSERDKYKTALEGVAEHLKLPCDKRDDGVLEQIVAEVRP